MSAVTIDEAWPSSPVHRRGAKSGVDVGFKNEDSERIVGSRGPFTFSQSARGTRRDIAITARSVRARIEWIVVHTMVRTTIHRLPDCR